MVIFRFMCVFDFLSRTKFTRRRCYANMCQSFYPSTYTSQSMKTQRKLFLPSATCATFYPSPRLIHLNLPSVPLPDITIPHLLTVTSLMIDSVRAQWNFYLYQLLDMLESMPHLQHFTFKSFDNFSYRPTSEIDYPRVISMPNLVSADVSAPGCGLDILPMSDALLLTSVRFDGYRPPGYLEDFSDALTIPIPTSLRRVSERSPKINL